MFTVELAILILPINSLIYFTILLCVIYFLAVFLNLSVQYSAVFSFRLNIDGTRNSRCKIFWSPFSISLRRHTTFDNQKALLLNQILMNVFFDIVMQTFCIAGRLVIAIAKVSLTLLCFPAIYK